MKRYELIKDNVYQILNENCFGNKRKLGLEHLFSVSATIQILALKQHLDIEIAAIIAILHDLSVYQLNTSFDHANRSSMLARDLLIKSNLFTDNEIQQIVTAIKNHSSKEKINDQYSELIKDADLLVQYLNEPEALLDISKQKRLENIIKTAI